MTSAYARIDREVRAGDPPFRFARVARALPRSVPPKSRARNVALLTVSGPPSSGPSHDRAHVPQHPPTSLETRSLRDAFERHRVGLVARLEGRRGRDGARPRERALPRRVPPRALPGGRARREAAGHGGGARGGRAASGAGRWRSAATPTSSSSSTPSVRRPEASDGVRRGAALSAVGRERWPSATRC